MLLGRGQESAIVASVLTAAREGHASGVVIVGEAGIGKSSLLAHAAAQADGMLVLEAGGVESESRLAWAGLHALFRTHEGAIHRLPPPQAAALRAALGLEDAALDGPFLVSAAVVTLVGTLAEERPVLLLVDDIQWLDRESLEALRFAMRRFDADRVAMVLACRSSESAAPDASDLGDDFRRVEVAPLDEAAVAEFLDTRVPLALDHRIRHRIIEAARGNPLALTELSAENAIATMERGSVPLATRLEQGFLRRAHALSEPARRLLVVAAANDSGDVREALAAGAAFGAGEAEVVEVERSRLVSVADGAIDFAHPLVRSAIYRDARPELRRAAHAALATATEPVDRLRATWHRAAATVRPDEAVARELEGLASSAQRRAAMQTSARAYRRAAELTEHVGQQVRCLTSAAEASWECGDTTAAATLVEEARGLARDDLAAARADHLRGLLEMNTGVLLEGFEILCTTVARVGVADPRLAATVLVDAYRAASFEGLDDRVRETAELAGRLGTDGEDAAGAFVAGVAALWLDDPDRATPLLAAVTERCRPSDEPGALCLSAMAALYTGDPGGALKDATRASVLARERGALSTLARALEIVSFADLATSLTRAESSAQEGLETARETRQNPSIAFHLGTLATIAAFRGDEAACKRWAGEVVDLTRRHGLAMPEARAIGALAVLDLGLGRPEPAMDRLERLFETTAHPVIRLSSAVDFVEAALRADRPDRATDVVRLVTGWARTSRTPSAAAIAARCAALVADGPDAERGFEQSLRLQEGQGESLDLARTHLLYGEHLRRVRRRADARPHLRAAWQVFERLGAVPWAERARAELRASGEAARSDRSAGPASLTPQERQIARLVAEGGTSKHVAAQLFLSPRTVDYHLRKVFTKTGISSRAQLRTLDLER
ncbi:MAG TPA: LuxR family transcriptional regulator [Kribbella sp.]|nr:LuxR family transcriptional regulator [Kribbella sp.]